MKRVLIMSDLHCGHRGGLTPPGWQYPADSPEHRLAWRKVQQEGWAFYKQEIDRLKPFHTIIVNGDAIDGQGKKSGGTEQITTDRQEQVDIAAYCVKVAQSKDTKVIIIRGTPYHTGSEEDWEDVLGLDVGAMKVGNHEWIGVDDVIFDCKHRVGGSAIPHGRHTSVARENLWNAIMSERGESPRSSVIVRSHVHYFQYAGDARWLGLTTPALQVAGSKFGSKICSGTVDYGFVVFDVEGDDYEWEIVSKTIKAALPKVVRV